MWTVCQRRHALDTMGLKIETTMIINKIYNIPVSHCTLKKEKVISVTIGIIYQTSVVTYGSSPPKGVPQYVNDPNPMYFLEQNDKCGERLG